MPKEKYFVITFTPYESAMVKWFYKFKNAEKYFNNTESWSTPILIKGSLIKGNLKNI